MPNSTWTVTNSTKKNLVVINASVDSDAPSEFYYDQNISLLSFSTGNGLAPGNTDDITLPDARTDGSGNSLPYTFIVAEAETLAPVTAVTCRADLSDLVALTVDDTTVSYMGEVFDFQKDIIAFPGSELAKAFAALDYTDDTAVRSFFSGTEDYRNVTLDALHLVNSYYNALPYGWANGKDTVIYLFGGTYEDVSDTEKVRSIGTITITNDWTLPLPVTVPEQFKIELKLSDDQAKQLVFSNGVFWDSAKTATAKLSLAGSFAVPSQLSLDDTNDNIGTFLIGSVNGTSAFGLQGVKPIDPNGDGSFLELFDVHSFRDGLTLGMYGISIVTGLFLLVKLGQFVRWCKTHGNPTVDQNERAAQTEALKQFITANARTVMNQVNDQIDILKLGNIPEAQGLYRELQLTSKTNQSIENVRKIVDAQSEQLAAIAAKASREGLQGVMDNIEIVRGKLDELTTPEAMIEFRKQLGNTVEALKANGTTIFVEKTKVNNRLTAQENEAFSRSFETSDRIRLRQERINDEIKEIEEGEDAHELVDLPDPPPVELS